MIYFQIYILVGTAFSCLVAHVMEKRNSFPNGALLLKAIGLIVVALIWPIAIAYGIRMRNK